MRYYSYNEYDPESALADDKGGYVVTLSEKAIKEEYYPYWYAKMCDRYGKEYVDATYTFEDCLTDWVTVHWAWEVDI